MFWRITHDFLKWLWPAAFGSCVVISGIAVAASQVWPEAKPQESSSGPLVEIDALHWRTHEAFPISVALGEPQSRQRLSLSREGGYDDLRVNRAEFEKEWPVAHGSSEGRARKRKLIDECRQIVASYDGDIGQQSQRKALESSAAYLALRQHLSQQFLEFVANQAMFMDPRNPGPLMMRAFARELDRLEKDWGLT